MPRPRLSYANIVATLALFLALGGSAVAAVVVTSDDIKDGTIRQRDLSPSLRAASTSSKPKLVFRRSRLLHVAPGQTGQASAVCPKGLVPTGGGAHTQSDNGTDTPLVVTGSEPFPPDETPHWSWVIEAKNTGAVGGRVEAIAICERAKGPARGPFPIGE